MAKSEQDGKHDDGTPQNPGFDGLVDVYEKRAEKGGVPVKVNDPKALPTTREALHSKLMHAWHPDDIKAWEADLRKADHANSDENRLKAVATDTSDQLITSEVARKKAEQKSLIDPLTGLPNIRYMHSTLDMKLAEIERYGEGNDQPFFMMLDIDYFKKINDTYGHQVGDFILKKIAGVMDEFARINDIVGRYGGEEFFVFALCNNDDGAVLFADRMRELIEDTVFRCTSDGVEVPDGQKADHEIQVTVSMGVARHQNGMTKEQLIKTADAALYESKKGEEIEL
jgi:diguanylate cyclase (GGDEF)-like protein